MSRGRALLTLFGLLLALGTGSAMAEPRHGIAMHGEPKFAAGFPHYPYANADAPKGGKLVLGATGSFDNLQPNIIKGELVAGVREWVYEPLMSRSLDEPFTLYGLIAETLEVSDDRRAVTFHLNPAAKFSDGQPITADDIIFSMELLRTKGRPNHRTYYKKIAQTEKLGERSVRFSFGPDGDREMPLIMGLMPVLPKHKINPDDFEKTTLSPPVGSGPYVVGEIDAGRSITFKRNPDYWGRDLPVNRGRFNFEEVRYEYFREPSVQFEAFKTGLIDLRYESDTQRWAEGYQIPAARDGRIALRQIETGLPAGMSALTFNTRRPVFQDGRVRRALIQLFDFEWLNKNLFSGLYRRTQSYFERSLLSSAGKPASDTERGLLGSDAASVREDILTGTYALPVTDASGNNRNTAREAFKLLAEAGYAIENGVMVNTTTKAPLTFEILSDSSGIERFLGNYVRDLAKLGITAKLRVVDSAQYTSRTKSFDYDMIQVAWPASLSPGNEQLFRWSSGAADNEGSFNYAGVKNPAVDAMIGKMLAAQTAEDFTAAVRALDRLLLSGDYAIPLFHGPKEWIAHWNHIRSPATPPLWGYNLDTWWIEGQKGS
jgi:peptide/nickel transport system substrate-binding protein